MEDINRLHDIADDIDRTSWGHELADALHHIAAHIGEEVDHMRHIGEYENDVLTFVDAFGGLEEVKELVSRFIDISGYESDEAAWAESLSGILDEWADLLGFPEQKGDPGKITARVSAVLDGTWRRLMPEGMEWPRYEDGEPVRPGDRLLDKGGDWFKAVSFVFTCDWWSVRGYQTEGFGDLNDKTRRKLEGMAYGTCVKRPAPKVLDADGVEIRKGDTVWSLGGGGPYTVAGFDGGTPYVLCDDGAGDMPALEPSALTHRAPVLAADGEPLEVGQTVWHIADGKEYTVEELFKNSAMVTPDGITGGRCRAEYLTHHRPVLAADGEPLREGDEVWSTIGEFDGKRTVKSVHIDPDEPPYAMFEEGREPYSCLCCCLTHRAPVLDADGKPLREGETVWHKSGLAHGVVESIDAGSLMHTVRYRDESGVEYRDAAKDLTHERPDSFSLIEQDAELCPYDYASKYGKPDGVSNGKFQRVDLVRRAKALAERGH